ncbi:MAG: STAS domain-containing protein [Phycisphaeraceae bacterium]
MQIHEERKGAVTVLRPSGPVTHADAEDLRRCVSEAGAASLGRVVLDVADVPYVDSGGLEALVELNEELSRSGRSLKLCGLNETLREVLDLTELGPLFEHYDDLASAVRSFL